MINIQELMPGNIIGKPYKGTVIICKVTTIHENRIETDAASHEPAFFEPVLLTEEWLLKLGFKVDSPIFTHIAIKGIRIRKEKDGFQLGNEKITIVEKDKPDVWFVHTLQNLVFQLSGQALKIYP